MVPAVCLFAGCSGGRLAGGEIEATVGGEVAPGFEEVRTEFVRNFTERNELGAACAVYYRGRNVVDLWGGYRDYDARKPWEAGTMVPVFSTTKGMAAMTLAVAHSHGWLDYNEKVAHYWPDFAQNGKENITVRQLLGHQAGLVEFDDELPVTMVADLDSTARFLARQKPEWVPGTRQGYHSSTLGLYMNALLSHADPKHRSLGTFFQEEIARPLGIRFYIGLPGDVPDSCVAHVEVASPAGGMMNISKAPLPMIARLIWPWSYLTKSFSVPAGFDPNDPAFRHIELPSGNGIGEARAIARAYGVFATGGTELGLRAETLEELTAPAAAADDAVLGLPSCYMLGFSRPGPDTLFGSSPRAFGTPGAGGSFGFADPDMGIGYAYVMTRMDYYPTNDPRDLALRRAVERCVRRIEAQAGP
ncbi:MAG: beta-lactamase family protein [Bacteroidetes bacterium]|nr:beta-lactamase family protein [Bacteroidota bacterium]